MMLRFLFTLGLAVSLAGAVQATPATDALDAAVAQVKAEIAQLQAPKPTPPVAATTWPLGWDDPRFANNVNSGRKTGLDSGQVVENVTIVDQSGEPAVLGSNYTLRNSRIRAREGVRVSGSPITVDGTYIEVSGVSPDHADGIQCFYGWKSVGGKVVVRNTFVKVTPAGSGDYTPNNGGIFFADYCAADLTLENVKVDGDGASNGAIWLPCNGNDKGVSRLTARNVEVSTTNNRQLLSIAPGSGSCVEIVEWTNVHRPDGTQVPRP